MNRYLHLLILYFFLFISNTLFARSYISISDTIIANEYQALGKKYAKEAKYDSSNIFFIKASELYISLAKKTENLKFWKKHVNSQVQIGTNYWKTRNHEKVFEFYNSALNKANENLEKNDLLIATCYHKVGNFYLVKNDPYNALKNYKESLKIRLPQLGKYNGEVAKIYNNFGLIYKIIGDYEKSLEHFKNSIAIKRTILDENHPSLASSYRNVCDVFRLLGDYDLAIEYVKRSLQIRKNTFGESHRFVGSVYNTLGTVYHEKGNFDQALHYYEKSLHIAMNLPKVFKPSIAGGYNNIGLLLINLGKYEQAIKNLNESNKIWKEIAPENNENIGRNYYNLGHAYTYQKKFDLAGNYYNKTLINWKQIYGPKHPYISELYQSIAKLYTIQAKYDLALDEIQIALISSSNNFKSNNIYSNPSVEDLNLESSLVTSLGLKAEILFNHYSDKSKELIDLKFSLSTYELAISIINKLRHSYKSEGSMLNLGQEVKKIYEGAIKISLLLHTILNENKYKQMTFNINQFSKANVLTHSLQEIRGKKFANISADILKKEKETKIDLAYYETEIQKEKLKNEKQDSTKLIDLERRFFNLNRKYEALVKNLEKSYPKYYELKYKTVTASVKDIQTALDKETALLEYFLGDSLIYFFSITKNDYDIKTMKRDSIFNSNLQSLLSSFKSVSLQSEYLKNASELYNILIKPVEINISDKKKWIIIPDGELSLLPFEALLTEPVKLKESVNFGKLNYLINKHEISYHYSSTLYLKSIENKQNKNYTYDFAGFAPVFSKENRTIAANDNMIFSLNSIKQLWDMITRDGKKLNKLKYSETEISEISKMFQSARKQTFVHDKASEENFKNKIKNTKFVHVATHGIVHNENPKLSNLAFSQPQDSVYDEDDGFLYSGETYNLNMNADLLVLSACQTGTGKLARGEGLMALTRGFLYSGTNNIIASLWKVFDEHTGQMMIELYKQILSGKSYSSALREAKLKMITNEATARPQSWASFVLIGK